jgi:hypothetical protein
MPQSTQQQQQLSHKMHQSRLGKLFLAVIAGAVLVFTNVVKVQYERALRDTDPEAILPRLSHPSMNSGYRERILLTTFIYSDSAVNRKYFRMFVESAKYSGVDLLIVGDPAPPFRLPHNVRHAQVSWGGLVDRLQEKVFNNTDVSLNKLRAAGPYKVNDIKPLFGFLFPEEVQGYDWWGTCDNDMLLGAVRNLLPPDVLSKRDVVSGLPDHNAWGPFTLYRNSETVNTLFRLSQTPLADIFDTDIPMWFDEWGQGAWFPEGDVRLQQAFNSSIGGILENHYDRLGLEILKDGFAFGYDDKCFIDAFDRNNIRPKEDAIRCNECNFQRGILTAQDPHEHLLLCHFQFSKKYLEKSLEDSERMQEMLEVGIFSASFPEGFDFIRNTPEYCIKTSRCLELERDRRFSFVHVSKSGGASWINELKNAGLRTFPEKQDGDEFSVSYQNGLEVRDHISLHLSSMRSPRHHTWSLWSECRFDRWGQRVTANNDFPRSGQNDEEDVLDFSLWINHFVDPHTKELIPESYDSFYSCYHPANYQSRAFEGVVPKPHWPGSPEAMIPNFTIAEQTYWYFDFMAIIEFNHESKCLFLHRLSPRNAVEQVYLDHTCHCKPILAEEEVEHHDIKTLHHNGRRRKSMRDLTPDILESISAATKVDEKLYVIALQQFMREMAWLEGEMKHRVVCDDVLEKWDAELEYLGVSVKQLYQDSGQRTLQYQ